MNVDRDKIEIVPNGVDLEYFSGLGNQLVAIDGYKPSGGWTYTINGAYAGEITTTGLNNGDIVKVTAH